jgi:3-oxoacyl-[acyl-carrier-protein] synthase II
LTFGRLPPVTDLRMDPRKTIVVTGIGLVSPYGIGMDCLREGMLSGKCCLSPTKDLYPGFVGSTAPVSGLLLPDRDNSSRYSRSDRLAMVAARDAVRDFDCESVAFRESGVMMASTVAGLSEIDPGIAEDPAAWYRRDGLARAATYPPARVADAVGEDLGVCGPRCAVSAACASSAMAIALAANLLLDGMAPMMLAGGSDALCPFTLSGFSSLQALDPDPCRPFDQNRKGLNLGEGAAVLVLETLDRAMARNANVLAVLRGWAMTNDAFHSTAPHEQGNGLADCMRLAMEKAEAGREEIGYVNAHGTGTPLNDVAEAHAYESVFRGRSRPIPVSSTKSYFGHCLGAAGALEAAITIAAVGCGALLPTLRLKDPIESPSVNWLRGGVRREELPLAMSVSAGFGGSNTALIFGSGRR